MSKKVKKNHEQPWYNEHIKSENILRWRKERQWENDNTECSFRAFYNQRKFVENLIRKYQKEYYNEALLGHKYDTKVIFKITNKLLFKDESLPLPSELNIKLLADNFNNFFIAKIDKIQDDLTSTKRNILDNTFIEDHYLTGHQLTRFEPVDEDYVAKLLQHTSKIMCFGSNTNTTSEETCPRGGTIHNSSYQPININRWNVTQPRGSMFKTTLEEN